MLKRTSLVLCFAGALWAAAGASDWAAPEIAWLVNPGDLRGQSPDSRVHKIVGLVPADVREVLYEPRRILVRSSGIPSYPVGPFRDRNPSIPTDRRWAFEIPRLPGETANKRETGLGPIGVFLNGVPMYNMHDGHSYRDERVWNQNAIIVRAPGMDASGGHPSPVGGPRARPENGIVAGAYHHHQLPEPLLVQLGDDPEEHSPLIGYSFDGFPVYGPRGHANRDGSGGFKRMQSSWRLRDVVKRENGPAASGRFPLGAFVEDFELAPGTGDLDEHNGRFTVTPEYPKGIYAYFATVDELGAPAYPYLIGPTYFGEPTAANRPRRRGPRARRPGL